MNNKSSKFTTRKHLVQEFLQVDFWKRIAGKRTPIQQKNIFLFLLALLVSTGTVTLLESIESLNREAALMGGIFVLAAFLWITEALPLFATALLVIGFEVLLLANPGNWSGLGFESGINPSYREMLAPFSDPIIILFLGGFILAQASVKEGVDKALASTLLRIFGQRPLWVMFGFMLVTAGFSMFMSNTATTAMMITLIIPLLGMIGKEDPFRKGLVLSIPFAANIGGMGTPIGSPPNAVAVGFLRSAGFEVTFMEWMVIAVPLTFLMLIFTWILLWNLYRPADKTLSITTSTHTIDRRGWFVIIVFSLTILLWLSDYYHGLPSAVVALLPAAAFTATGIIKRSDYNSLEWHILTLIAGGIALGVGMSLTGLDHFLISLIPSGREFIFPVLILTTVLLSTFMSNTAAANLIIPLGISFAIVSGDADNSVYYGIGIALAASISMSLPISTPPNAIAYARGVVSTRDFLVAGAVVGLVGTLLIAFLSEPIIHFCLELFL